MEEVDDKTRLIKILQREVTVGQHQKMWVLGKESIQLIPIALQKVDLEKGLCWATTTIDDEVEGTPILKANMRIKIYLTSSSLFIFSKIKTFKKESNLLKFDFPDVGFFKERRGEDRHLAQDSASLDFTKATHYSGTYSVGSRPIKKVFDISAGGLSFLMGKGEAMPYGAGDRMEQVFLEIGGKRLRVTLQVSAILKIKPFIFESIPYGNRKVCCEIIFSKESDKPKWTRFLSNFFPLPNRDDK